MKTYDKFIKKFYIQGFLIGADRARKALGVEMEITESTEFLDDLAKKFEKEYDKTFNLTRKDKI